MPPKIVVVGSFNTDLVMYVSQLPQSGESVAGQRFMTGPGGKGSNQAVAAARLGAQVAFVGRVGQDGFANVGLHLWEKEHIDARYVVRDPRNPTGIASIFVEDSGENLMGLAIGANAALSPADVDQAQAVIAEADVLLTQLEIPLETVAHALQVARDHGVKTILNPAPAIHLPAQILALADYLTPNEAEFQILFGKNIGAIESEADALLTMPTQTIIVTLGAWGAMWVHADGHGSIGGLHVDTVDAVGAGAAFNAALAVAIAEGRSLKDTVAFANAAAALAVTKPGAAASMPYRREVDVLLAQQSADIDEIKDT